MTVTQPRKRDLAAYLTKSDWDGQAEPAETSRPVLQGGVATPVPVFARETLGAGIRLTGPCLVEESQSVTYIPGGSVGSVTPEGYLLISVGEKE